MGENPLRVGIVGSRKYENLKKIKDFIFKLKNEKGIDTVVVGNGSKNGAGKYVKKYTLEFGLQYQEFPPFHDNWNIYCPKNKSDYGKPYNAKNYFARNKIVAAYSKYLVAFIPRGDKSLHAKSTVEYAKKFGKKTIVID